VVYVGWDGVPYEGAVGPSLSLLTTWKTYFVIFPSLLRTWKTSPSHGLLRVAGSCCSISSARVLRPGFWQTGSIFPSLSADYSCPTAP
jgi:hypothetical protein